MVRGLSNFEKKENSMILAKLHTRVRVLATSLFVRIGRKREREPLWSYAQVLIV